MANCVGCKTPIPAGATKCPMCGAPTLSFEPTLSQHTPPIQPIVQQVTEVHHHHTIRQDQPILIEATSKKWKKLYLFAWLFLFLGMVSCGAGMDSNPPGGAAMTFASIFWMLAIGTYIRARVGAWWHHG